MENQNNNPKKTLDNLKDEFVRGEDVKGGGGPVASGPTPVVPFGPPILNSDMGILPDQMNPPILNDGTVPAIFGDDGNMPPIVTDEGY